MIKLPGIYLHNDSLGWCYKSLKTGNYVFMQASNGGFDLVETNNRPQFLALNMREAVQQLRQPTLEVDIVKDKPDIVETLADLFEKIVLDDADVDRDFPLVVHTDDGNQLVDWSLVNTQFVRDWVSSSKKDGVFSDEDLVGLSVPFDKTPHQVLADSVLNYLKRTLEA